MNEQKRTRVRVKYSANALVKSENRGTVQGVVRDISIDAMYLTCKSIFSVGEKVKVEIILLGKKSEMIIRVPATVTRTDQDGVSLSFLTPLEWWPVFSLFPLHQIDVENATVST
jgi:hypothetical protein